jgi:pimeloyl-ACP methyl ester carboxylesterase
LDEGEEVQSLADFVLIHSTGQSPAGWERLMQSLEHRGYRAHAVDLPTDEPELRADDYAEIIRGQVGGIGKPVVVAHSGSGVLLPGAAAALHARHQVWLAAWVPDRHASFSEEVARHAASAFNPEWIGKDPTTDAGVATNFLYHDCDQQTLEWALTTRRLFVPLAAFDERISLNDGISSTYIVATDDRTIRPDWQRRMARERLRVEPIEIPSGHCPNVSRPDLLAEILLRTVVSMFPLL